MSENTVYVRKYKGTEKELVVSEREVLRYSGFAGQLSAADDSLKDLLAEVMTDLEGAFSYSVCYRRMDISWKDGMPILPFEASSKDLATCLAGSKEVILFAGTIGIGIDRYIARYQYVSPARALIAQAFGAERVEALCDLFCGQIREEVKGDGLYITPRFSPGYGDLELKTQKELCSLLDCNRKIGVSLNDSLLMTPSKSVTAIFGLTSCDRGRAEHKCSTCDKEDCEFRNRD